MFTSHVEGSVIIYKETLDRIKFMTVLIHIQRSYKRTSGVVILL